ncbi:MAG TPA: hypothetical protein VFL19_03135 [Nitrospira sp.]|nr:hypothetical protein [Nitrospira sp.]
MKLSHFSPTRITSVRSVEQSPLPDMKPRGLWVSVDGKDDWPSWCKSERFGPIGAGRHVFRYRVDVDLSRVLHLDTAAAVMRFNDEYVREKLAGKFPGLPESPFKLSIWIDWSAVAAKYAGIIIAPYQWARRLELMWYYGWDCASGCIWDAAAVRSISVIRQRRPSRTRAVSTARRSRSR